MDLFIALFHLDHSDQRRATVRLQMQSFVDDIFHVVKVAFIKESWTF